MEELLNSVECVFDKDYHIVEEPIGLSCGHCICKRCIPQSSDFLIAEIDFRVESLIQIYYSRNFTTIFASKNFLYYSFIDICVFNNLLISKQNRDFVFYDMQGKLIKKIENAESDSYAWNGLDLIKNKLIVTTANKKLYVFDKIIIIIFLHFISIYRSCKNHFLLKNTESMISVV